MAPPKTNELQAEIKQLRENLSAKIDGLDESIKNFKIDEIRKTLVSIESQLGEVKSEGEAVAKLQKEMKEMKAENDSLNKQVEKLNQRLVALESYGRRENLIFQGVPIGENENCWDLIKGILMSQMKMSSDTVNAMKIQRCHRLYENNRKTNKIIVRFMWYPDRERVWSARFQLAKTKIYINEDFPQEIILKRQILLPILKKAKQLKKRCTLSGDKLIIESRTYTVNNLHMLPPELNPAEIATRRSPEVTAFFTEMSPLSNFFRCNIEVENQVYHSVEQYLQLQKAIFAEDEMRKTSIRNAKTPSECKSIAREIRVDEKNWLPRAAEAVRNACRVKFTNNEVARNFLISTRNTTLAEASLDKVWGIGRRLSDKDLFKKPFDGQNLLGKILEEIRSSIT
jgi:ribA/ribD-fused uncharacterized protein